MDAKEMNFELNGIDADEMKEIEELKASEYVKLGRKAERIRWIQKQKLYQLRALDKKGRELKEAGITSEKLDEIAKILKEELNE